MPWIWDQNIKRRDASEPTPMKCSVLRKLSDIKRIDVMHRIGTIYSAKPLAIWEIMPALFCLSSKTPHKKERLSNDSLSCISIWKDMLFQEGHLLNINIVSSLQSVNIHTGCYAITHIITSVPNNTFETGIDITFADQGANLTSCNIIDNQ